MWQAKALRFILSVARPLINRKLALLLLLRGLASLLFLACHRIPYTTLATPPGNMLPPGHIRGGAFLPYIPSKHTNKRVNLRDFISLFGCLGMGWMREGKPHHKGKNIIILKVFYLYLGAFLIPLSSTPSLVLFFVIRIYLSRLYVGIKSS